MRDEGLGSGGDEGLENGGWGFVVGSAVVVTSISSYSCSEA